MTPCVLHISDLHRDPTNPISNGILLDSLERDRDQYTASEDPRISEPNFIVVSGDIVQGVKHSDPSAESNLRKQYHEALEFLNSLTLRFARGEKDRVIIVPGNHDVNDFRFRKCLETCQHRKDAKKEGSISESYALPCYGGGEAGPVIGAGGEADEVEPAQVVVQIAGGDAAAGAQEVLQPALLQSPAIW